MVETEYRFYQPGKLALGSGRGEITAHEGIEVVTFLCGERIVANGTVRMTSASPEWDMPEIATTSVLGTDTGVGIFTGAISGVGSYRKSVAFCTNGNSIRIWGFWGFKPFQQP